jgi:UDP-glucose 4-epimerase
MKVSGKRVVVTGGAGFIGSHVVDRLVSVEAEVVVLDDLSVGRRENLAAATERGATLIAGDICDAELVENTLAGAAAVIHMACGNLRASLRNPLHTDRVNSTGSLIVALGAAKADLERFVYVSSSEAYGSAVTEPMSEDHPLRPTTVYGASKAAGELYAQGCMRTYGLPVTVIRPFNSYGPREHSSGNSAEVIPKFVSRIRAGLAPVIFGDGSQTRDFTWVEETAAGIVAATECDALVGEAVNIACGTQVSILEISRLLVELMGSDIEPEVSEARPGDVATHWADTSKAKDVIGFEASVPIEVGLKRYVDWVLAGGDDVEEAEPDVVRNW